MSRLLNVLRAFKSSSNGCYIHRSELEVIAFIHQRNLAGMDTTVTNIVMTNEFGSPPTVQAKINKLHLIKFLLIQKCSKDTRRNVLIVTNSALKYLDEYYLFINSWSQIINVD